MVRILCLLACSICLLVGAADARAGIKTVVFDFEDQPATSNGGLTSLSLTKDSLSITIDRVGEPFDIANLSAFAGTADWGSRTLAPTPPGANLFNIDFS